MSDNPERTRAKRNQPAASKRTDYVARDDQRATGAIPRDDASLRELAVEAAIWAMPIVSVDAMRQAFFRDAGAEYGDIVYLSRFADWHFQIATPNASTHYVYFNFNVNGGPVVLEIPAAVGAGLFGSILDAWQVPVGDVGPAGDDEGKGGKYLLLPPGYEDNVAGDFFAVPLETFNGYVALRAIATDSSETATRRAIDLVQRLRVYPLSEAAVPPTPRFIDMSDRLFDGIVRFDESFFDSLARMINEEQELPRDAEMYERLAALGIVKGQSFGPDDRMHTILRDAAIDAQEQLMGAAAGSVVPYWPDTRWGVPATGGPSYENGFVSNGRVDVQTRGVFFFLACAPPKKLGKASFYLSAFTDASGAALTSEKSYRLHVSPNVPAAQFWAVTVYALDTASFMRDVPRVEVNSYDESVVKNDDGSVDVFFGPNAPSNRETNWIPTGEGERWFAFFRLYGPQPALFDKTWKLPDIETVA
jgi:hypothetical protein